MKRDVEIECAGYIGPEPYVKGFKNEADCKADLKELYENDLKACGKDVNLFLAENTIAENNYHIEMRPVNNPYNGGYIIDCEIIKRILE